MQALIIQLFQPQPEGRLPTVPEMVYEFLRREQELIEEAMRAEQFGFNWRGVRFGAAVLACRRALRQSDRFAVFNGSNFTPTWLPRPEDREKLCAEIMAAKLAFDAGFPIIAGVALFSRHLQKDDTTGQSFRTPHPCWQCTERYESWVSEFVRFVTVRPKFACDRIDPADDGSELVIERRKLADIAREHRHATGP